MDGLRAEGVTVALAGRPVLRGAGLEVPTGKVTALVGPSGAGKSTLLRALVRLVPVVAGTVTLDGADVTTLDARALRRRVGLVAQAPVMLPGTVADNLRHGEPALGEAGVRSALAAASLDAAFAGRVAAELSGGERARVALARALTREPQLLLLDEPTAALDAESAARIGATLRGLAERGLGVCVTTHDLAFADAWADRREELRPAASLAGATTSHRPAPPSTATSDRAASSPSASTPDRAASPPSAATPDRAAGAPEDAHP